jgi:hypothetical protein
MMIMSQKRFISVLNSHDGSLWGRGREGDKCERAVAQSLIPGMSRNSRDEKTVYLIAFMVHGGGEHDER